MILIDSNIFMYAGGAAHAHKEPSAAFLRRVAQGEVEAAIDIDVLQEVLHRYRTIGCWSDGSRVYDLARRIVPAVLPITAEVMDPARDLMDTYPQLAARDALHTAVAKANGITQICSYDRDFDAVQDVERVEPRG